MQENILFGVREFIVGCSNILIPPVDTLYNIQIPLTHWLASTYDHEAMFIPSFSLSARRWVLQSRSVWLVQ